MTNLAVSDIERKRLEVQKHVNMLITELERYCQGCNICVSNDYIELTHVDGFTRRANNVRIDVFLGGE